MYSGALREMDEFLLQQASKGEEQEGGGEGGAGEEGGGGGGRRSWDWKQSQDARTTKDREHPRSKAGAKKQKGIFYSNKQKDSSSREALAEAAAAWRVGNGSGDVDMLKANMLAAAKWRGGEGMRQAVAGE